MKKQSREKAARPKQKRKRLALWIVLGILVIGLIFGALHVKRILTKPETFFTEAAPTVKPEATLLAPAFPIVTPPPTAAATKTVSVSIPQGTPAPAEAPKDSPAADGAVQTTPAASETPAPTPSPTASSTPRPSAANTLNIMLMGIDAYENGGTTSGTMPHTDVMMVIAINFDENTVDLITLPRDTLTTAPGYHGYYKLNGVFNVGLGGWKKPKGRSDELAEGFLLTCRAAEQWLGGISIPYYYGVDFQAVIDIVDTIGGIDYDVDQPFHSHSGSRSYGKGMHHLDGDAVLGYLRIRQSADGLDSSRTARQRRMMVAIFKKLKSEGRLSQIPSLINAANSGVYTNTTLSQTTALANYAASLEGENIHTWSMYGEIGTIEYEWRYVYVDQQNRIDLIREIFGIQAEPVGTCTRQYERWLHQVGFSAMKYMRQAEKLLARVQEMKDAGATFTDRQIGLYSDCYLAYTALRESFDDATETLAAEYAYTPWREKKNPNRNAWTQDNIDQDRDLTALENSIKQNIRGLQAALKTAATNLADAIGYHKLSWGIYPKWYEDPDINEVIVAFG